MIENCATDIGLTLKKVNKDMVNFLKESSEYANMTNFKQGEDNSSCNE